MISLKCIALFSLIVYDYVNDGSMLEDLVILQGLFDPAVALYEYLLGLYIRCMNISLDSILCVWITLSYKP